MTELSKMDLHSRKEIADALWSLFCLHSEHVTFSFDEDGVSIRVPFTNSVDLDGPAVISGITRGYNSYSEFEMGRKE
ncbi:hypothetical protein LCGC14_1697670 [marine sediment metagenome]|uniref:Uncharacterized protein n=1 Tax=marine sediment metagenome TaxID=412755 RepID=A0A0F9JZF5_9ZZZZ